MIYLLYGMDKYLINYKVDQIIKDNNINKFDTCNYDLTTDLLSNIIDDANTLSMFNEKRCIICDSSFIFTSQEEEINQNIDLLNQYISSPNSNTILIFKVLTSKLDERKNIVKLMKSNANIIELKAADNIYKIVKEKLAGYTISEATINLFIKRVGNDVGMVNNELDKLIAYKINELEINEEDIKNLTYKNLELDVFKLVDYIVSKDIPKALELYNAIIKNGEEPIKLLVLLANQFRLIYQVKTLHPMTEAEIASKLGVHPYSVKLAKQKAYQFSEKQLLKYLSDLADIDIQIKSGQINKQFALELFILNI